MVKTEIEKQGNTITKVKVDHRYLTSLKNVTDRHKKLEIHFSFYSNPISLYARVIPNFSVGEVLNASTKSYIAKIGD